MGWNNAAEFKKFDEEEKAFIELCKKSGMDPKAAESMYEFDYAVFKSDRRYYSHVCDFEVNTTEENTEDLIDSIFDRLPETKDVKIEEEAVFDWIEEINDKKLYHAVKSLSLNQLIFLNWIVKKGLSQREIAQIYGISEAAVSNRLERIRKAVNGYFDT